MNKVKDFLNWTKIVFEDRTILRDDLKYMSWQQIRSLDDLEVRTSEEDGKELTLFV